MTKSGPVILPDGTRGVFIDEETLARGGDAFQYLIRLNYDDALEMDESGYNVFTVMSLLKGAQKNSPAKKYEKRRQL